MSISWCACRAVSRTVPPTPVLNWNTPWVSKSAATFVTSCRYAATASLFLYGYTNDTYPGEKLLLDTVPYLAPVTVSIPWFVGVPDRRPRSRKRVSMRRPRPSAATSGTRRMVRPAGLVNAAVASSARATNALPSASDRAPGLKKSNSSGTCKLAWADANDGTSAAMSNNNSAKKTCLRPLIIDRPRHRNRSRKLGEVVRGGIILETVMGVNDNLRQNRYP